VGIILPDRQSSNRWISSDPIALKARCKADNLTCDIQNANNSATQFVAIAQSMMNNGAKVLILTALDPASAGKVETQAKAKGIITIDYDRLVTGGSGSLYVSFDNTKVGQLQGQTLVTCPQVKGKSSVTYVDVNGAPTDNNATLFKNGYDSVLSKQAGWKKVADQSIADWNNQQAGVTFAAMLQKNPGIQAVMVANDGMAGAVITDLKKQKLAGKVAVSGQDATVQGLQGIMNGTQCFSIYKPSVKEAYPAVDAAAQFATGQIPKTTQVTVDPTNKRKVPSILATPIAITKANVAMPINDAYTPKAQTCAGTYAALCAKAGVK
jgi:D-xylose transport system substrate-binding protein